MYIIQKRPDKKNSDQKRGGKLGSLLLGIEML
jgi:hypothetical protein